VVNVNHKSQTNLHYADILQPDWSLLLLVNIQDSFSYTVNKVAYRKHHFTTSSGYINFPSVCGR